MNFIDLPDPAERFATFIRKRESIRYLREHEVSWPWTKDEILQKYSFCNVNREDDAVTRWIAKHVRPKLKTLQTAVPSLLLCRIFNEPKTLKDIGFPLIEGEMRYVEAHLSALRMLGQKILRGAYMMPAHGTAGLGQTTEQYWVRAVRDSLHIDWEPCDSLQDVATQLRTIRGLAGFLANQVCADLRYTVRQKEWPDWGTFVLCGPGSRRGLDRFHGREPRGGMAEAQYICELLEVRKQVPSLTADAPSGKAPLGNQFDKIFRDPNNLSNCFCEWDKYERARDAHLNHNKATLRVHHGNKSE